MRFSVTSDEPIQEGTATLDGSQKMAGYLLKKRRKRMQGKKGLIKKERESTPMIAIVYRAKQDELYLFGTFVIH